MKQEPDLMKSIEDAERLSDLLKIGVSFFDAFQLVYNRNCDDEEGNVLPCDPPQDLLGDLYFPGVKAFLDNIKIITDDYKEKKVIGTIQDEVFSEIAPDVNYSQKQNS